MAVDPAVLAYARAVKGFMPDDEGLALHRAGLAAARSRLGPLLEVGTYCGKSAVYLGAAAREEGSVLLTIDHHRGSEENQAGWEHHDRSVVDPRTGRMDTLPWARQAIETAGLEDSVVLVVGGSTTVAAIWMAPWPCSSSTAATERTWPGRTTDRGLRRWRAGGWMAIHDVFPDPADGGRPTV